MNVSKLKRDELIKTLEFLRKNIVDNEIRFKIDEIENELTLKNYGLIWEKHEEEVDEKLKTKIPVFKEEKKFEIFSKKELPLNFLKETYNIAQNQSSVFLEEKYSYCK